MVNEQRAAPAKSRTASSYPPRAFIHNLVQRAGVQLFGDPDDLPQVDGVVVGHVQ